MEREKKAFQLFFTGMQPVGVLVPPGRRTQALGLPRSQPVPEAPEGSVPGCLRDQKPSSGESLPDNNSSSFPTGSLAF